MSLTLRTSGSAGKHGRAAGEPDATRLPHSSQQPESNRWSPPPSFFDNLSKKPLCWRILREFDRRTRQHPYAPQPLSREVSSAEYASLKRFARIGGPSLDDVRSYPECDSHTAPPRRGTQPNESGSAAGPASSKSRSDTRKTSAYDDTFKQHLDDHGIDLMGEGKPANLDQIRQALRQRRASLSPSKFTDDDFKAFQKFNYRVQSGAKVMSSGFPTIIGKSDIPNGQNVRFGNLAPLTDGSLHKAQPDFYDGCHPNELKHSIRDELNEYIVPSTNASNPILPNFFAEAKGPRGLYSESALQASYDAICGARAMLSLRTYNDVETAIDGNAYTISATYIGGHWEGQLRLYATHPTASEEADRSLDYHTTMLGAWAMTDSAETFRQGAAAIRNAREWAQEQRQALIVAANAKVSATPAAAAAAAAASAKSASASGMQDTDSSSSDELASDDIRHNLSHSLSLTPRSPTLSTAQSRKPKQKHATANQDQ